MFLEYTSTKGKRYSLRPYQIGALEEDGPETLIYASIGGNPVLFRVKRPYTDVRKELHEATGQAAEQDMGA